MPLLLRSRDRLQRADAVHFSETHSGRTGGQATVDGVPARLVSGRGRRQRRTAAGAAGFCARLMLTPKVALTNVCTNVRFPSKKGVPRTCP